MKEINNSKEENSASDRKNSVAKKMIGTPVESSSSAEHANNSRVRPESIASSSDDVIFAKTLTYGRHFPMKGLALYYRSC